jgi:sigma-B regulation protein RsbU (phosphoserine phosphatase)
VENLNRLVYRNTDPGKFVTLFLGELNKERHVLRYVRAGHDEPVLVSADGEVKMLREGSFVLGFVPDTTYDVAEAALEAGDVLCLYTDGVTEARDPGDREFELSGVVEHLKGAREGSAREIGEGLIAAVRAFSGLEQQADDITLVVLKVTG